MLGCALGPGLHMLGRALHSGSHIKVASVLVHHGVVCCFSTVQLTLKNLTGDCQEMFHHYDNSYIPGQKSLGNLTKLQLVMHYFEVGSH